MGFESFGATRLRRPGDPPNTGPEPDAAFYIGAKAPAYADAAQGPDPDGACDQFVMENPPDLVIEVESTHADEHKLTAYRGLGIAEVWRTQGTQSARNVSVRILKSTSSGYKNVPTSPVLGLSGPEIAQLINAPEKNAMRPDSPYARAVHGAAKKVQRHIEKRRPTQLACRAKMQRPNDEIRRPSPG